MKTFLEKPVEQGSLPWAQSNANEKTYFAQVESTRKRSQRRRASRDARKKPQQKTDKVLLKGQYPAGYAYTGQWGFVKRAVLWLFGMRPHVVSNLAPGDSADRILIYIVRPGFYPAYLLLAESGKSFDESLLIEIKGPLEIFTL